MATRTLWVLNLDAEYELAAPRSYTPSQQTLARVAAQARGIRGLLGADDVLLLPGEAAPERGLRGAAWCPTPGALRRLREAGAEPPDHPELAVLQRVNDRRFGVELAPGPLASRYATTLQDALAWLQAPSPSGRWVAKRAFGLAGRGQRRFDATPDALDRYWLQGCFKLGHGVVIEPWVAREADFVIHGVVTRAGDVSLGRPLQQECDARGMWQRTLASPQSGSPAWLEAGELEQLQRAARQAGAALHAAGYFGPFGIDAYRYVDASGQRRFNPLVEINARYCMGWGLSGLPSPVSSDG